jgi:hypothetical protein
LGNQQPQSEEGQTIQWSREKKKRQITMVNKTLHSKKNKKDRATQTVYTIQA